jgi:hypothetical protein
MRRVVFSWFMTAAACAWPASSLAQSVDQVAAPPPNLVLGNYDSVPVGPFGGLEGSAYGARVGDPSAAWFNPAGLSRQSTAQISGSAGVGVSGTWARLQSAAGFNRHVGTAEDLVVRNRLNADPLQTSVDVRTTGFIYSIAYQF